MYNEESILSFFNPKNADCEAIYRFAIQLVLAYGAVYRSCISLVWVCIRIMLCNSDTAVATIVCRLFQSKTPYLSVQESVCVNPLLARYFAQSVLNYLICEDPWRLNIFEWSYLYVETQLLCYNCFNKRVRRGVLSAIQQVRDNILNYARERGQSIRIALNQAMILKGILEEDDELCFRRINESVGDTAETCLRLAVALAKAYEFSNFESDAVIIETAIGILGLNKSPVISAYHLIEMMPEIFIKTNVNCVNSSDIDSMSLEYLPILAPFCDNDRMTDWGENQQLVNADIPVMDAVIWVAYALHMSQFRTWNRQSSFEIAAPNMGAELCAPPKTIWEILFDVTEDGVYAAIADNNQINSFSVPFPDRAEMSTTALIHSIELIQRQISDWFIVKYLVVGQPTIVYPACFSSDEGQEMCAAFQQIEQSSIDAFYPQDKHLVAEYRHADHLLSLAVADNMDLMDSCMHLIIYVTPSEVEAALIRISSDHEIWTGLYTIEEFHACSVRYEELDKLEKYISTVSSRYPGIAALIGIRGGNTDLIRDILQRYNIISKILTETDTIKHLNKGTARIYSYNAECEMLKIQRFPSEYPIEGASDSI